MSNKTIITPDEVVHFTAVKLPFSPCTLREAYQYDYYEFRKCLGLDFRADLVATEVDYSGVSEWAQGTVYNSGDNVKYKGIIYTSTSNANTDRPTVVTKWTVAIKFSETKYNDLFCDFLAPYLATTILANRLPYLVSQITDEGVVEYDARGYKASDKDSIERLRKTLFADRQRTFDNMDHFLTNDENSVDPLFENYKGNLKTCTCGTCSQCRPGQTRVGRYRFA